MEDLTQRPDLENDRLTITEGDDHSLNALIGPDQTVNLAPSMCKFCEENPVQTLYHFLCDTCATCKKCGSDFTVTSERSRVLRCMNCLARREWA